MRKLIGLLSLLVISLAMLPTASAIGLLIPNDDGVRPFDVESHRATVTITNNAAVTTVQQVFRNHTERPMEAVFVFPIPDGGTVSDFSLWINGKKTAGAVLEKHEARRVYESIVRRARDPGLVEYMDGKLFRASIFPIPPGGTQKLELKFGQVLAKEGGMYSYTYPVAAGAQYVTAKAASDFTLTATVNSSIPITNVYSPSHTIGVQRVSDAKVVLGTEEMNVELDRDFQLFLSYSKKDIGVSLLAHDPDGAGSEDGYFMLAIAPRVEAAATEEIGQTFTFVMDTSGSMAGEKIEHARETLAFCISRLDTNDHFNVVRFATTVEPLWDLPKLANAQNRKLATLFARELEPAGGTAIEPALALALAQKTPKHQPHQVIFVTDGRPTVGKTEVAAILDSVRAKRTSNARVFTFGVGFEVNAVLLDGLARTGRGRADYVKPGQNLENAVATLYSRIASPVLSDVKVDFGKTRVHDTYPNPIGDLFRGDQIVLFGRHRSAFEDKVVVRGRVGSEQRTFEFGGGGGDARPVALDASSAAPLEFLPKLWATRKVGFLLEQIRLNGEDPELKAEVIRLAQKFGLVTPYTSYLAVDDSEFESAPRGEPQRRLDSLDSVETRRAPRKDVSRNDASRPRPASAPRRSARTLEKSLSRDVFGDSSGEGAVAASEAIRDYQETTKVSDSPDTDRRWVARRTFAWNGSVWIEDGLADFDLTKATLIAAYSKKYFELLRDHPEVKRMAGALGDSFIAKIGKRVVRVVPPDK